ncbi:MAG: hypothetical protein IPL73_21030 [Candidatus Obscuribacter sp.]|nr:hypothetical protein [Candidatus Obscuribacter sp.]MBK9204864.1 hypothetical protein [Candidatus Obscuribacter sp.]MBK9620644.1 hypothetical protein [Candidatus Obscuribacter sp.]
MATKSFDLGNFAYQAGPMIWGSLQNVAGMTTVQNAAPFVVAQDMPGTDYVMDTRGRLTNANLTNGQGEAYNMDDAGNRVSVVTT